MFKIFDGRESFFQWDLNQKLIISDATVDEVHFCNKTDDCALVCRVYDEAGLRVVDVPNILLQDNWDIRAYAYCKRCYTKQQARFKVIPRSKPADYIYTETEKVTVAQLIAEGFEEAKANGDFKGDKGDKGDAGAIKIIPVDDFPTENIDENAIYLKPTTNYIGGDKFEEYIYIDGAWERIGGVSAEINLDGYVKTTDYATTKTAGVMKVGAGLTTMGSGEVQIYPATNRAIDGKSNVEAITPQFLDYAVKVGVTTNTETLTDKEKESACNWLGAVGKDYVDNQLLQTNMNVSNVSWKVDLINQEKAEIKEDINQLKFNKADISYVDEAIANIEVSGGGTDEVYIGTTEPTDANVEIWINPEVQGTEFATQEYVDNKIAGITDADIIDKIIDPDNNPLLVTEDSVLDIPMEVGGLSTGSGELSERDDAIRSNDFILVTPNETIQFASNLPVGGDEKIRVCCYGEDKTFIETVYSRLQTNLYIEADWHYIKFYRSDTGDGQVTMSVVRKGEVEKAEFKKIYFADHGYEIYGANIDDETMHKLVVYASGKDENTFNIIEVKAPSHNPEEATICLMNWGNDAKQFVDFSSMVYNPENPTAEIVCQTRGGKKLPEFSIRYNDGQGAGRVKKFSVHPDAIPIELTAQGLKVRKNNTFDNNGTEEDYVVINLAEVAESINDIAENYATKDYVDEVLGVIENGTY